MDRCSQCGKKKAQKKCPALGNEICHLCCGLLRGKKVNCPSSCVHLLTHQAFQEKRTVGKKAAHHSKPVAGDILKEERMRWLLIHIELPLKEAAQHRPTLSDREALGALEYARNEIVRGKGWIVLPGQSLKPVNSLGEAVLESMDRCRFERKIILATKSDAYQDEEKLRCLDWVIAQAEALAKGRGEGRNYLDRLVEMYDRMQRQGSKSKIVSPS